MKVVVLFLGLSFLLLSCDFLKVENKDDHVVVAVGEYLLTNNDIASYIEKERIFAKDSSSLVKKHIIDWATKKLLYDKAQQNLSEEDIVHLDALTNTYKENIYVNKYLQKLAVKSVDTFVSLPELTNYYESHKENFKLHEDMFMIKYLHILNSNQNFKEVVRKFRRFNKTDRRQLDSLSLQFIPFYFNDSTWVSASMVYSNLKTLQPRQVNKNAKNRFLQIPDEANQGYYLLKINDVLEAGQNAPLSAIESKIKQIIINNRRQKFLAQLKREIVNESIKKNNLVIYE